jgi:hypothetical protein
MFRAVPLPIIRSIPLYTRHCYWSFRFVDRFQAGPGWSCTAVPSWSCLKAVIKTAWPITAPSVQWDTPDDGQRNCPKYVAFLDKINLGN